MVQRENFPTLILNTIKHYYKQKYNIDIELCETNRRRSADLFLYYVPLFLSTRKVSKKAKELLYAEYNIRGNIGKYILGKLLVFFVSHSKGLLASKCYKISSCINDSEIYICPCNRTVRFYDFKKDTVDCMLKNGYSSVLMHNQITFRNSKNYSFVPPVLGSGQDWYSEKIMHGHALARVTNKQLYHLSINKAIEDIGCIVHDTIHYINNHEYAQILDSELESILLKLGFEEGSQEVETINSFKNILRSKIEVTTFKVPLCISHGDLQEGNIWVKDDGQILIYDWETVATRSVWYDPLTLFFGLHNKPYDDELGVFVRNNKQFLIYDLEKNYSETELLSIEHIIVFEDMLFQLTEATQLSENYIRVRTNQIINNIKRSSYWRIQ